MTEGHDPLPRRRRTGGGVRRALAIAGWLVALALAANLAVSQFRESFLTPAVLRWFGLWVPVAIALALCGAGVFWTTRGLARSEKSSLLWLRRAFLVAPAPTLAIAVMSFEDWARQNATAFASIAAALQAVQLALFAVVAHRENVRAASARRRSRDGGSRESAAPLLPSELGDA